MLGTAWHCRKATAGTSHGHPVEIKTACLFGLPNPVQMILRGLSLRLSHWSHVRGVSQSVPITLYRENNTPRSKVPPIHYGDLLETHWPLFLRTDSKSQCFLSAVADKTVQQTIEKVKLRSWCKAQAVFILTPKARPRKYFINDVK